jgi:hypothetical protein
VKPPAQIGETVSHLSILEKLGVGMGAVNNAEDTFPLLHHTESPVYSI